MRRISFLLAFWSGFAYGAPLRLAFDWDDNVVVMPTKVHLIHKVTGKEWDISSAEFAIARLQLGKPGTPYEAYMATDDFEKGSHRDFADLQGDGVNRFLADLKSALPGPKWDAFVEALSRPQTAAETGIVTARMHEPDSVLEGLRWLQSQGRIRYLPLLENIWCVRNSQFTTRFRDTFGDLPDEIRANGSFRKGVLLEREIERVWAAGGRHWSYSDDDWATIEALRSRWTERMNRGDWPTLTLQLEYTGHRKSDFDPHSLILRAPKVVRDHYELVSFASRCGAFSGK